MSKMYAARSMVVYKVWFNERQNSKKIIDSSDLNGKDILALFNRFCESNSEPSQINDTERFISFGTCTVENDYAFAKYSSGRAGLQVSVIDTTTLNKSNIKYGEDMAGMVESRMLLRRTPGMGYAVACIESVPNGGGFTAPLSMFRKFIGNGKLDVSMRYEHVQEIEALRAFKGIEEIELRRYSKPNDVSDSTIINSGTISHRIGHKARALMPLRLFDEFLHNRKAVAEYMGVETSYNGKEELFVTLRQVEGGSKKFSLSKDLAIPVREVLNESGEKPLEDAAFINRCIESCKRAENTLDRIW